MSNDSKLQLNDLLAGLPKFSAWILANQPKPPTIDTLPELHIWNMGKALRAAEPTRTKIWTENVEQVTKITANFLPHILDTDHLAVALGSSLSDLYTQLAESSIVSGNGIKAFHALESLATHSRLAAFRFLTAWTALNMDEIDRCIHECELVDEPFAPIQTLLGQALLEKGLVAEAIDSLKTACELDRSDPLPLVQLIKAYIVSGIQIEAMRCIEKCRKILGNNIEIECLASMVIMMGPNRSGDFCDKTLNRISTYFEASSGDIETFAIGMNLAADLQRHDWAKKFVDIWEIPEDANPYQIAGKVSEILKKTGELHWHELSKHIIDKTMVITGTNNNSNVMQ